MANTKKPITAEARARGIVPDGALRAVPGFSGTATNQGQMGDEAIGLYIMDLGYVNHSSATTNVNLGSKIAPFDYKIVGAMVAVEDGFGTSSATARTLTVGTKEDADRFVDDYIFATDTATGALQIFSTATAWVETEGSAGDEIVWAVQQTTTVTAGRTGLCLFLVPRA